MTFASVAALAVALMLPIGIHTAHADEWPCPKHLACWQVRAAVAALGEDAAIAHARACGWNEAKITQAKRCLK